MPRYRVTAIAEVEVVTFIEAESWQKAERECRDREVDLCIHGSEIQGHEDEEEFTLTDGSYYNVKNFDAEEH